MKKFILFLLAISLVGNSSMVYANKEVSVKQVNPLLKPFDTPFGVPPFDKINNEHYKPAYEYALEKHNKEIEAVLSNTAKPSFSNTIEALEKSGSDLSRISRIFFAVKAAHTNDDLEALAQEMSPKLSAHYDNIFLNKKLYKRVQAVYKKRKQYNLNTEQNRLLNEINKWFIRSGANLSEKKQARLKAINTRLSELSQAFSKNLLKETNDFWVYVDKREDLGELPESLVASAAKAAEKNGHAGKWAFSLSRPSINPFLQASPNRELRQRLFEGYELRGNNSNEQDNKKILAEMASLRYEKAKLKGYKTHADYVLEDNVAKTPKTAMKLLDQVWWPALEIAKRERDDLEKFMHQDNVKGELKAWDWRYYAEKVRKQRYDLDENELRPYFEVNAVRDGVFKVANKLFGLQFKRLEDAPVWHPDQQVFEVLEADGSHLGVVYMDFFARESKRGGAWMNALRTQSKFGGDTKAIVTNNFNYPPPTKGSPSLLSFREAAVLFHEFGHALHGLFSNVTYESLAGTSVPRDYVEFPSQVFENWMHQPEVLRLFAKHYQTGEVIPDALIEKVMAAKQFNQGFETIEYLAASFLDLEWHMLKTSKRQDVEALEQSVTKRLKLFEQIIPRYRSTYFAHIFAGGYSAGYYGYIWSEIMDADAFEAFKETSLFDQKAAALYRQEILAVGGTREGMDSYKAFRGREPKIEPLLKRRGLLAK